MRGFKVLSVLFFVLVVAAGALLVASGGEAADPPKVKAEAILSGCVDSGISGKATLVEESTEEGVKRVRVKILAKGLSDGKHAVHIHQTASCTPCGSAGGHFDPGPNSNTSPDGNHPFHMGDLVNIDVKNGNGLLQTTTTRVTLSPGPLSLFDADGSAFIIHDFPDSYCPGGPSAGCAGGSRAACGIITLAN